MTQEQLIQELKQGVIRRIYYLHGKETFLVQSFAARIASRCGADEFNLVRFTGNPDLSTLCESIETLPVFASRRAVMLNDFDAEKLDGDYLAVFEKIPEETCVVIYLTGISADTKKAKTKKLISVVEKLGAAVNFEKMGGITEAITKRAASMGCVISRDNALELARLCLNNYTLIIREIEKLCAFAGYTGEITRRSIEMLTAKQLESGVFALAGEITAKRSASAMKLLDELIEQGNAPVMIMSSLAMTFIDFYRAKLGSNSLKNAGQIVKDFAYAPNRTWVVGKAMTAVTRISVSQARECVRVLCDADYSLKSSPVSDRIIMERAVARLLILC
jgi:DNA polymerase-3 subunit delta